MIDQYPALAELHRLSAAAFHLLVSMDGARGSHGTVDSERICQAHGLAPAELSPTLRELQGHGMVLCLESTSSVFITQRGHRTLEMLRLFHTGAERRAEHSMARAGAA